MEPSLHRLQPHGLDLGHMARFRSHDLQNLPLEHGHVLAASGEEARIVMEELHVGNMAAVTAIHVTRRLRLAAWIRVEVDFAEVVCAGDQFTLVATSAGVHISTISALWPNAADIESERA